MGILSNAVANTNKIIDTLGSLFHAARIPPTNLIANGQVEGDEDENENGATAAFDETRSAVVENDKSMIDLILLGMNESKTTQSTPPYN